MQKFWFAVADARLHERTRLAWCNLFEFRYSEVNATHTTWHIFDLFWWPFWSSLLFTAVDSSSVVHRRSPFFVFDCFQTSLDHMVCPYSKTCLPKLYLLFWVWNLKFLKLWRRHHQLTHAKTVFGKGCHSKGHTLVAHLQTAHSFSHIAMINLKGQARNPAHRSKSYYMQAETAKPVSYSVRIGCLLYTKRRAKLLYQNTFNDCDTWIIHDMNQQVSIRQKVPQNHWDADQTYTKLVGQQSTRYKSGLRTGVQVEHCSSGTKQFPKVVIHEHKQMSSVQSSSSPTPAWQDEKNIILDWTKLDRLWAHLAWLGLAWNKASLLMT